LEEIKMDHAHHHYVNGARVEPLQPNLLDVINPSTEEPFIRIAVGGPADVNRAVAAAKEAFPSFARTTRKQRLDLLRAILSEYQKRRKDIADTLSQEMGAPLKAGGRGRCKRSFHHHRAGCQRGSVQQD
jgi:aldehyde dehydrogenase (NAD+)